MKKTIIVEILLLFVLAVLLAFCIKIWNYIALLIEWATGVDEASASYVYESVYIALPYSLLTLIALPITLFVIILIALKDLPVFKPLADKLTARKEKRTQAKAERAEADKQARIAELENELEELKKN